MQTAYAEAALNSNSARAYFEDLTTSNGSTDAGATTTKVVTYPGNPRKFFLAVAVVPLAP